MRKLVISLLISCLLGDSLAARAVPDLPSPARPARPSASLFQIAAVPPEPTVSFEPIISLGQAGSEQGLRHQAGELLQTPMTRRQAVKLMLKGGVIGGAVLTAFGGGREIYRPFEAIPDSLQAPGLSVPLRRGGQLGYTRHGIPSRLTIVYIPGIGGSRLDRTLDMDTLVEHLGIQVIAIDPPGVGLSSPRNAASLLEAVQDVEDLVLSLGLNRFIVLGHSLGGRLAAACAHAMPEKIITLGLVSAVGPMEKAEDRALYRPEDRSTMEHVLNTPFLAARQLWRDLRDKVLHHWPDYLRDQSLAMSPDDQRILSLDGISEILHTSSLEFVRQGTWNVERYLQMMFAPLGFPLEAIPTLTYIWHGRDDRRVPVGVGERLAQAIPGSIGYFLPGRGHHFILVLLQSILDLLTAPHVRLPESWIPSGKARDIRVRSGQTAAQALRQASEGRRAKPHQPPFHVQWKSSTGEVKPLDRSEWDRVILQRGDQLILSIDPPASIHSLSQTAPPATEHRLATAA